MRKAIYTALVFGLLSGTMLIARHISKLNHQIEFKQIEIKDNSARLKLLDSKYDELNKELETKDADKAKVEKELKDLQVERQKLQEALQAKLKKKQQDIASRAVQAVAPTAHAATCGDAKSCIYFHESGNNPAAVNRSSGACGIGQALPCSKLPCSSADYACQDAWFTNYAIQRYGSWDAAWSFWQANKWW